jgi:hypothetical protein
VQTFEHTKVIVLANRSGETLPQTRDKAMEIMLPLKAPEPEPAPQPQPLNEAEMKNYTGIYSHAPRTWEVLIREDRLHLKHEGAERPLTKVGPHTFVSGDGEQFVFVPGPHGMAEHLFLGLYAARKVQSGR